MIQAPTSQLDDLAAAIPYAMAQLLVSAGSRSFSSSFNSPERQLTRLDLRRSAIDAVYWLASTLQSLQHPFSPGYIHKRHCCVSSSLHLCFLQRLAQQSRMVAGQSQRMSPPAERFSHWCGAIWRWRNGSVTTLFSPNSHDKSRLSSRRRFSQASKPC